MTIQIASYQVSLTARYHVPRRRNVRLPQALPRGPLAPELPVLLATVAGAAAVLVHVLCVVGGAL